MISVRVPVVIEGETRYVLTMALSSELFMPRGRVACSFVLDRCCDGRGRPLRGSLPRNGPLRRPANQRQVPRRLLGQRRGCAVESVSLDGVPILASFARSSNEALTAVISYPLAEFDGIFRRALGG